MTNLQLLPAVTPEQQAEARQLLAQIERADGASPVSDQAMIAATQGARELFLVRHDGTAAGVAVLGEQELDLALLPSFKAVEQAALAELLARAGGELRSWVHGDRPDTSAALAGAGFVPARDLFRMTLDPDLLPEAGTDPLDLPTPEGTRLRTFAAERDAEEDAAAWVAANAAAFATHPEQGRISVEDFAQMRAEPWFDSWDLILLDAGDELAGSTWVKTLRDDEGGVTCELYAVGVRPEYAGRGLGKLLLQATLARMAQHGPEAVSLYVDGDNTAAVQLYERAGFTVDSRSRQWIRPDSDAPNATMGS